MPAVLAPVSTERDLRLDLFRGLALWLIFLDHIPSNAVSWITIRNYGFSDATEIFVFISGYTAAFVYGRAMRSSGFIVGSARLLKRTWQIYVAHVFLFAIYLAEISYVAHTFDNPLYSEEMGMLDFLQNPDVTIIQALLLKFKPVNMDVLPLYIALLGCFAPMLWLLLRAPSIALLASATLYALMWQFDWNIAAYPKGVWVFNPFAWQLLFVFGAWCALGGAQRLSRWINSRVVFALAIAYLCFAFFIAMTWYIPRLGAVVPDFVNEDDLSNRQDQSRRFAHFALPLAGDRGAVVRATRLAGTEIESGVAGDPVRPTFAGNLLPRRVPVLCRSLRVHRSVQSGADACCRQPQRHCHYGWLRVLDFMV